MGKKCTKVEKKARVEELADMIVKGYSQRELNRHVVMDGDCPKIQLCFTSAKPETLLRPIWLI